MKKAATILLMLVATTSLWAQDGLNGNPDAIIGTYWLNHEGDVSKVRMFKCKDGTYAAQCIYLQDSIDKKTGKVRLDTKKPDKSLRHVPCNRVIILRDLRYNAKKQRWEGGRIYDPRRGLRAQCTCVFMPDGRLKMRGSLLGIGETIYWQPVK